VPHLTFAERLLEWFDQHGRKTLPWQREPTPYRVWLSEIMLQQTQVTTATPYFERFTERFPELHSLAEAGIDEVLHLWSGLGYYARARNLHKAAVQIVAEHSGEFPQTIDEVEALPGIGRSTAGAILALSMGQRHPILDGNVKRVLTRYHAIEGWPGTTATSRELWNYAEKHTPEQRAGDYTQAIMDLGATLCRRSRPECEMCPLVASCAAHAKGRVAELPTPRPRRTQPIRATRMALLCNSVGEVLLEQRPPSGIWGGLWSLPEIDEGEEPSDWAMRKFSCQIDSVETWPTLRHTFSHFHLDITPLLLHTRSENRALMEADRALWYNSRQPDRCGLAAPIKRLLLRLKEHIEGEEHEPHGQLRKTGSRG